MSRFDYVRYDDDAQAKQAKLKAAAQKVEAAMVALDEAQIEFQTQITESLDDGSRPYELAFEKTREACLTEDCFDKLEEAYMWCGKGLRDQQIERNGSAPLQEERGNE
jgi:hypothetical protein